MIFIPILRGTSAGAKLIYKFFVYDTSVTTGAGLSGKAYSDFTVKYIRQGEALSGAITPENITTIGTYVAPTANTNCRIKEISSSAPCIGYYELQIHADWVATTNTPADLTIFITVTGGKIAPIEIPLTTFDLQAAIAQIGDAYARLGAPAGASVSADIAAVKSDTAAILTDTGTTLDGKIDTIAGYLDTEVAAILAAVDTEVAAIKTKTDYLPSATAGAAGGLFIAGSNAATTVNITGTIATVTNLTNAPTNGDLTATMKTSVTTACSASSPSVALIDDAITAAKFDESTAYPLKSADTGSTAVARTGADSDTLETLSDQLDSVSSQISSIGSGTGAALNFAVSADNASSPIKSISSVGTQTGTYANTSADDTSNHVIDSVGNAIDWVYEIDVGIAKSASKVIWKGTLSGTVGQTDTFTFQAYRFDTSAWETRFVIINTTAASQIFDITLLSRNTGSSGADKGKVYIRILFSEADAGVITTNLMLIQANQSGSLVGYSDGAVWLNTNASNTNTVPYIDGVADNPVSTIAAALTLLAALNMKRVRVANGSTVTLGASVANYSFIGRNWTLALGGQAIDGAYLEGAEVSGTGTCTTQAEFVDCYINAGTTTGPSRYSHCGFAGSSGSPFTLGSTGEIVFVDCFSEVAGSGTPYFTLNGASGINFRRWSGGSNITLNSASATMTMEVVTGGGQTLVCAGASVEYRGIFRAVTITGIASTSTIQIDAVTGPISLAGADGTVRVYGVCATVTDSRTGTPTLNNFALSQDTVPNVVWDEALTGATHNTTNSAGRRLRQLTSQVVWEGTAQGAGADNNQIQLDTGASSTDGAYDPSLIAIVNGTGAGQSRLILQYVGSTKMATVDRGWKVSPSTDSEFIIYAHPGREHVNEGLAQAGASSSITLNALASSLNNNYNGQLVFIRSGTGEDQVRLITAYNGTTKVATVSEAWGTTPDSTSGYVILPNHCHEPSEIADAVWDEAISDHAGAGSTGAALSAASAPSAATVADAVWDEALSGHSGAGTAGLALATASSGGVDPSVLADAIWDEALSGHSTAGTAGKKLTDLVNTDLSGVATSAELAKVPKSDGSATFNATALASINTQCDTALSDVGLTTTITGRIDATITSRGVALDAAGVRSALGVATANIDTQLDAIPTVTEFNARTIVAANYALDATVAKSAELDKVPKSDGSTTWNATALASINAEVDTALNTAIPGSPTANSINERIVAIDAYGAPPTVAAISDGVWDETIAGHAVAGSTGAALSTASSGGVDPAVLADAVWDEAIAGHTTPGSTGQSLNAAGVAGDPWVALIPGSYADGTAGDVMGKLDAIVDKIDTMIETDPDGINH